MIKMVRIDERLIHGQVAMIWTKQLGVDRIIVVNDKAANDPIMTSTLKMAAPDRAKAIILDQEKAKTLLNDPRAAALKILVVVNSPKDALVLVENVKGIPKVNIGNYGKADTSGGPKEKLNDNVFLSEENRSDLKKIIALGIMTEYQLVPDQPVIDIKKIL